MYDVQILHFRYGGKLFHFFFGLFWAFFSCLGMGIGWGYFSRVFFFSFSVLGQVVCTKDSAKCVWERICMGIWCLGSLYNHDGTDIQE
jgi:hypothetical protein